MSALRTSLVLLSVQHEEMNGMPEIDRCPWCEDEGRDVRGTIDHRIKIAGRYVYRCPADREHSWQDADEKPSEKGFTPVIGG